MISSLARTLVVVFVTAHPVRRVEEGDLEILFTQPAPCGEWLPVNPRWEVDGRSVILHYAWVTRYPSAPAPTALCTKFIRAWVFAVPKGDYRAAVGKDVPRTAASRLRRLAATAHVPRQTLQTTLGP